MSTFSPVIRGGPTWLAFLVLAGVGATPVPGSAESPRYTLRGSFEASPRSQAGAASMQRDAEAGNPLELDAIGGAVVRAAERHGLAVPVTSRYVDELRARYPS